MTDWTTKTVEELRALVAYHDLRYWTLNAPEISDAEYDELVKALREKSPEDAKLDEIKSLEVSSGKVHHAVPMLSLQKAHSFNEVLEWAKTVCRNENENLIVSPKYDGVAGDWCDGVLSTRGDGNDGDDLSGKLSMIELESDSGCNPPLGSFKENCRGEILMKSDEFARHHGTFKTQRAAAAGLLGRNEADSDFTLSFVRYDLHEIRLMKRDLTETRWHEIQTQFRALPYPQDGIVLKLADQAYGDSLGCTAHHPHSAVAFKFGESGTWSKIVNVVWQINRQDVTPVAEIEPVEINGRTVSRVTLHNAKYVQENDVRIGDSVEVILSGDVIPKIVGIEYGDQRTKCMIYYCPCCGSELQWRGARLVCKNPECEAVVKAAFLDLATKLGMKGFGQAGCDYFYGIGCRSREDMLKKMIKIQHDGFIGFTEPASGLKKILTAPIRLTEAQKLVACDVFMLGPVIANRLTQQFTLETIFSHGGDTVFFSSPGLLPEQAIPGRIAQGIQNRQAIWELIERLTKVHENRQKKNNTLRSGNGKNLFGSIAAQNTPGYPDLNLSAVKQVGNGEVICLTGRMPWVRADLYKVCVKAGYIPVDKFCSDVSLVVYADCGSNSRKMMGAQRKGIPTEDILDFVHRIHAV